MAREKIWVWKRLLHPCLGIYLSNLDRTSPFLTCPQPPCGPGQCSCLFLENSREQGAAGIKQLSLTHHGFWPSPPKQSQVLPCHMHNQSSVALFQNQHQRWAPTAGKAEGWGMQGLGPKEIQDGPDSKWTQPWWPICADHHTALRSLSKAPGQKQIYLLYSLYEFSFCWRTVTALLCLPEYRFLPENHSLKVRENFTFGSKFTQGNC